MAAELGKLKAHPMVSYNLPYFVTDTVELPIKAALPKPVSWRAWERLPYGWDLLLTAKLLV